MTELKILWIDDDVNGPELMSERDALEEKNCVVTPITNPDQLQLEDIPSFNCLIMDLFMPTGKKLSFQETRGGSRTGFVLLKKIKDKYPDFKTIVYSVFEVPEVRSYCMEKNSIEYWNKSSLSADEFANNLIKFIKGE